MTPTASAKPCYLRDFLNETASDVKRNGGFPLNRPEVETIFWEATYDWCQIIARSAWPGMSAAEIAGETIGKIWKFPKCYDGRAKFTTWIKPCIRHAKEDIRRRNQQYIGGEEAEKILKRQASSPIDKLDDQVFVDQVLHMLSAKEKRIVELEQKRLAGEISAKEAAQLLRWSLSKYFRERGKMRGRLSRLF